MLEVTATHRSKEENDLLIEQLHQLREEFMMDRITPVDAHARADALLKSGVSDKVREAYDAAVGISNVESPTINSERRCVGSGSLGRPTLTTPKFEGVCMNCSRTVKRNSMGFLLEHSR